MLGFYKLAGILHYALAADMIIVGNTWYQRIIQNHSHLSSAEFKATIKGTDFQFDSAKHIFKIMSGLWPKGFTKHHIAKEKKKSRGATIYLVVDAMLEFIGGRFRVNHETALVLGGYENYAEKSQRHTGVKRQQVLRMDDLPVGVADLFQRTLRATTHCDQVSTAAPPSKRIMAQ